MGLSTSPESIERAAAIRAAGWVGAKVNDCALTCKCQS